MKRFCVVLAVVAMWVSPVLCSVLCAQDAGAAPAPKAPGDRPAMERPALTDITVAGKITKEERPGREGKPMVRYMLTEASGNKVMLPGERRRHEGAEAAAPVDLAPYVDKEVTIVGKGFTMEREGVKHVRIVEITKIEPAVAAAPAVPAN